MTTALALLAGCDSVPIKPTSAVDQCLRTRLFRECMAAMPAGPTHVGTSNDWDEVIKECDNAAYYQSIRRVENITVECRP
jgi:hypothetical protein